MQSILPGARTATPIEKQLPGGRFGKANVLSLLGAALYETKEGNDDRALLYLGTALVALHYRKASFALQGVLVADRVLGKYAGERPLAAVFGE